MPDVTAPQANERFGAHYIAPDAHGLDFYAIDRQFQGLMSLYLEPGLRETMTPHFARLGALAGTRLDELAMIADRHPPVLHQRDRFGRDEDWIDYHPAYREMEKVAFEEYGLHAMSHRAGVLGMTETAHPLVKYAFTYLFVQAEFGLMCPVSMSDTSNFTLKTHGSPELKRLLLDRLLSQDPARMMKAAQLMTREGGRLRRRRDRDRGRADRRRRRRRRALAHLRPEMVLQPCRRRHRPDAGAAARRRARHQGARHVRPAAPPRGRPAQRLSHRAAEGQARHALDGLGRDRARRRDGLAGGRLGAGLQADDEPGQSLAAQPRRARRRHDAALPQRGAAGGTRPARLRAAPSSTIRCCAAS